MYFDVPQYIEVEDKIAFQLTAKQLGWFALGGVGIFLVWNYAPRGMFILWAFLIVMISLAFAFVRPYGISLSSFIGYGFLFLVRPKQFIWQRQVNLNLNSLEENEVQKTDTKLPEKNLDDLDNLSHVLDRKNFDKIK